MFLLYLPCLLERQVSVASLLSEPLGFLTVHAQLVKKKRIKCADIWHFCSESLLPFLGTQIVWTTQKKA